MRCYLEKLFEVVTLKKGFFSCPECIDESELYGFSWLESVLAIPSPLVCVTSYKENGLPNVTMQSWCTFIGELGFHVLFSSVNRWSHMYSSVLAKKQFVVNFSSKDVFMKCMASIEKNGYDNDEIIACGLTAEPASEVDAPMIKECFLNLECELEWTRELVEGRDLHVFCAKVVGIHMDDEHYDLEKLGRYGETGYMYNIHRPINPDTGSFIETRVGFISGLTTYDKL